MGNGDPVLARLDMVDKAAQELHAELSVLRDRMSTTRRLREQGYALSEALVRSQSPASQEMVAVHMARLTQAVHDYRCAIVRHLVDTEGWSLSDIAARTGNARQVVSRLYHACDGVHNGSCPQPKFQFREALTRGSYPAAGTAPSHWRANRRWRPTCSSSLIDGA